MYRMIPCIGRHPIQGIISSHLVLESDDGHSFQRYCFHCEIPVQSGADTTDWERMMKSIGPNVRKVDVVDGYNCEIATIFNLLDRLHFEKLEFENVGLSEIES